MAWHNYKEFKCSICGKDFDTPRQIKSHMKDAHGKKVSKKEIQSMRRTK